MGRNFALDDRWSDSGVGRLRSARGVAVTELVHAARVYGANGMAFGPDGRLYVAQALANRVSALDVTTLELETIIPVGSAIEGPDDVAFDDRGNLFVTDVLGGKVWVRRPDGTLVVAAEDSPAANGIASRDGRVFVSEWRPAGRIIEVFSDGTSPHVLIEGLNFPNAMAFAPDGYLYFPAVARGEVWRVDLAAGTPPECVLRGLRTPTAVKTDRDGNIVVTSGGDGRIVCFNPGTGRSWVRARHLGGYDNLAFDRDGRTFVSWNTTGRIGEVNEDGSLSELIPAGMVWPLDLVEGPDGLIVSDGLKLALVTKDGTIEPIAFGSASGFPLMCRGIDLISPGVVVLSTSGGDVSLFNVADSLASPLASGLQSPTGVVVDGDGVLVAESGTGRILRIGRDRSLATVATGLEGPLGVALAPDGAVFVSEPNAGRVTVLRDGGPVSDFHGFKRPEGVVVDETQLIVLDVADRSLVRVDLVTRKRTVLVEDLPVGLPAFSARERSGHAPGMTHLARPYAGLALGTDGQVYVPCAGNGTVLKVTIL